MKNLLIYVLFITSILNAQVSPQQRDLMNFEPGELIVKLKDNLDAGITYAKNGKATSSFNIGQLLGISDKVKSSTMMFHQKGIEASIVNKEKMKAVYAAKAAANPNNGYSPKEPLTMKNIFVLKTSDEQENILQLIQQIIDDPNVEYAEPNYIYSIDNFEVGDVITAEEASKISKSNSSSTIEVNDPLYSSQSNITSTNIDDVWEQYTTGDGSQVIAILDTGVDYTHPDLEANIWINEAELNGVAGYDDDENGYIDDIRGWDFINIDNAPLDDNMHGTHVAGIAGAVGNNGIGIAGAAWNVKLMPIKVFQSTGQGSSITIAEGVEYASNNGATIINMSFASAAESITLRLALENAFATAILVAASGNNGIKIGKCSKCQEFYPAAYSFVIGVEAENAGFSNTDAFFDGPIQTNWGPNRLYNYEVAAPGIDIISTVPNGGYATLSGTSMAAPLVAGGLALYKEINPDDSRELILGNLINTGEEYGLGTNYDLLAAIEVVPLPMLTIISTEERDEIDDQNANGFWEPGETIEILPLVKNYWGPTEDVRIGIEFAEFEDQSKATIIHDEIQVGSMTAYSTLQDLNETLKITIANGVSNNVDIGFELRVWSGPDQQYISEPISFVLKVTNAVIFTDYITEDMTITNDREWIFQNSMVVANGAHLIIEAGTTIKMANNTRIIVDEDSSIISNGTSENPVVITSWGDGIPLWRGVSIESNVGGLTSSGTTLRAGDNSFTYTSIDQLNEIGNEPYFSRAKFYNTYFKNFGLDNSLYIAFFEGPSYYENCEFREFNYGLGGVYGAYHGLIADGVFLNKCNIYEGIEVQNALGYFVNSNVYGGFNFTMNVNISNIDYVSPNFDNTSITKSIIDLDEFADNGYLGPFYNGNIGLNIYNFNNFWNAHIATEIQSLNMGKAPIEPGIVQYPPQLWLGSEKEEVVKKKFYDYSTSLYFAGLIDYTNIPQTPFEGNHGIVWKVDVNGYNSQDEYALLDPIGVGPHEFKVYFNRAMDTSVDPQVSYGVTIPYNQKIITETGTWSSDGKIYTVSHEVNIGAADGINRIRVQDAQDLDYFKIPVEDTRFNFLLQSAGSASTGFLAQGGLGKVDLEWMAPSTDEIDDALGYNMYRYQIDADGVESEPIQLNESLIIEDTDENTTGIYYSDFDVLEGETYFYKYKILRTSFEETDFSQTVSSAPLTSTLGDSNGDFAVDVMDLVHDVDYILGNNPTPFIFLAGDVNADLAINVLDIVGTVDIILNPSSSSVSSVGSNGIQFYPSEAIGNAIFTWEGNDLYVASNFDIGGVQLAFNTDFEYVLSEDLPTIEHLDYTQEDSKILMLYSFNNTMIASSKTKILTRIDASQEFDIEQAVVGTTTGAKLNATLNNGTLSTIDAPFQNNNLQFLNLFPNPTQGLVNLEYYLPNQMDQVVAKVYDMLGRLVHIQLLENRAGISKIPMELSRLKTGNYIVLITANKGGSIKNIANKKLIVK
nr:peptidase, S8 family [uncultured bacterium]